MSFGQAILSEVRRLQNLQQYRKIHWEGSFSEYLDIVQQHPEVTRTAFQRLYDMILSHGTEEIFEHKEKIIRYKFFTEWAAKYGDAVYGLERPLMQLVNTFKAAAKGFGTERRVLLLHGPVGSAKSTIVRLLKRGLEEYSRTDEGMLFSFMWKSDRSGWEKCPMHEEPLHLVPAEMRPVILARLNEGRREDQFQVSIRGDLCPFCRFLFNERLQRYNGDWAAMTENEIRVYRLILSEQDRVGIGTFQPKDEKNQDSTELTGDINYRKIAEYGSDSDPRCVVGDTWLATGEGLVPIAELFPASLPRDTFLPRMVSVTSIGRQRVTQADSIYHAGTYSVVTITTRFGYQLRGSPNHMVLTLTPQGEPAWIELRLIRPGDFVALGRGVHTWSQHDSPLPSPNGKPETSQPGPKFPQTMSPRLAYLVGLWIGGQTGKKPLVSTAQTLIWPGTTAALRELITRLIGELFGVSYCCVGTDGDVPGVQVHDQAISRWWREALGLDPDASRLAIPSCVLRSKQESVLACLAGLWHGQGRIDREGSQTAFFTTASDVLAEQLQVLLLAFGIIADRQFQNGTWQLQVAGEDAPHLTQLLADAPLTGTIPAELPMLWTRRDEIVPWVRPKLRAMCQRALNRDQLLSRFAELQNEGTHGVAYQLLAEFLDAVRLPADDTEIQRCYAQLNHLRQQNHIWLPVEHIERTGQASLYDLSIPATHAYWANGFICHNCFNFDGELNIANRGLVEFIEVLKLDVAFLYDLLCASQEHKIKPKKFAQCDIDEVIIGHSVAGWTPIAYRYEGVPGWATLEQLYERFADAPAGLEVLAYDFASAQPRWTPVRSLFRHRFTGQLLTTVQAWGVVETTPNHSIYARTGEMFYPQECREVLAVRRLPLSWAEPVPGEMVDISEAIADCVREKVAVASPAGRSSVAGCSARPFRDSASDGTSLRTLYDPISDSHLLQDLLTVLVWYASRGRLGQQGRCLVISGTDCAELERVGQALSRISTAPATLRRGVEGGRLVIQSETVADLAGHLCGVQPGEKRLPDFVFRLPADYLRQVFEEFVRSLGHCLLTDSQTGTPSSPVQFRTSSPMLAAQLGTLASLVGYDYAVSREDRSGRSPTYLLRFGLKGHGEGIWSNRFRPRLRVREVVHEWVYDIECEGLHNFICGVGNIVCHNTNEPEYRKLQNNEFMEALRDRTVKIDIPYVTRLRDEIKIYEKDFNPERVKGKHIAPHTIEVAAMWAVLTRLVPPKHANLTLLQKLKLYNGKTLPGFTEDNIIELKREAPHEGMSGISPRYIQDKISNALVAHPEETCVNPFMVLHELEAGLRHHSLITSEEQYRHYKELLQVVREEYEDVVKNEVQRAIAADEEALSRLCANYIDHVKAYTQREKVRNRYTGAFEEPDERLMRSIEEKIDIPESRKDDFRREIMNYIGALAIDGKKFDYKTNERLQKALELKLFEDQKDTIKLTSLVSNVVDKATQEKIDVVKSRLIRNYGYCEVCATDVLQFVASIFARGSTSRK